MIWRVLAIDPGDKFTGVAVLANDGSSWACVQHHIYEHGENGAGGWEPLLKALGAELRADRIVVERWQLYPGTAPTQFGKDMLASQLIGAILWEAHQLGIPVVQQQAVIKKPAAAWLRRTGYKFQTPAKPDHARDAEIHGWAYLLTIKEIS